MELKASNFPEEKYIQTRENISQWLNLYIFFTVKTHNLLSSFLKKKKHNGIAGGGTTQGHLPLKFGIILTASLGTHIAGLQGRSVYDAFVAVEAVLVQVQESALLTAHLGMESCCVIV